MTAQTLSLIDHHVHGTVAGPLDDAGVEILLTEASNLPTPAISVFDSQLGFAVRRWCAPLLDLEPSAPADRYLQRRAELGSDEVNGRLLRAARVESWLVDSGYQTAQVLTPAQFAEASGTPAHEIVRIEAVAERVARAEPARTATRRGSLTRSRPRPRARSGSSPSSPTGTGWTSIRPGRAPPRYGTRPGAGSGNSTATRPPGSKTRSCSGTASGPGWTSGCRSSSTSAWATPTCGCTGPTRR